MSPLTYRTGLASGIFFTLALVGAGAAGWWIFMAPKTASVAEKPTPPAKVGQILKEEAINTITLTPQAMARLGLKTAPVARKATPRSRIYGGETTLPPGRSIFVAAPLGGLLQEADGGTPTPGSVVRKGQEILRLLPLLSPEARTTLAQARVEADNQVSAAETQVEAARVAVDRARRLLADQAGSQRNVDETRAQFELAEKSLGAAKARRDLLARVAGEAERGTAAPLPIVASESGLLRTVSALPGQSVPAGGALFEIVDLSRVWIRTPVFVGDLAELAPGEAAQVGALTAKPGAPQRTALPVAAPPTANAATATVDLFHELDNREAKLAPGERVAVALRLRGEATSLTAPWSAVVHDIHGGTWVYEQTGPAAFTRRRVRVREALGGLAILESGPEAGLAVLLPQGPDAGAPVVSAGAAELFGTEVGFSK